VFVFGQFQAFSGPEPLAILQSRKAQELLAYLLLYRQQVHGREALAALLWPDQAADQARRYLRKTLWQLQSGLEPSGAAAVGADLESVWLDPTGLWSDVTCFEQAFALARNIAGEALDTEMAHALEEAVRLYRGELLEAWYSEWCLAERQRLQHLYLILVDKLMRYCACHGRLDSGLQFGYQILRYDSAREHTHRELMRLLYLAGDRTGAMRQYQQCERVLAQELGVEPAESTRALYRQICDDRLALGGPLAFLSSARPADPAASGPTALLEQDLNSLQATLNQLRSHLQQLLSSD
jgi:DNA-binding SARP family transcriptional activator